MKKICVGMSDEERKEILDGKEIEIPFSSDDIKIFNEDKKSISIAKKLLTTNFHKKKIAKMIYDEFFQIGNQNQGAVYPVKMEVKTFKNETVILKENEQNPKLYISITLDRIEKEELSIAPQKQINGSYGSENSSKIMLRDLLENVNIKSESLIKYIPDGYLSPEKLEVKRKALEKEKEYILQKQKNRAIKVEQRQQRREERKGEGVEKISLAEKNLRTLRDRKGESLEAIKQPPETKQPSLAEKNLMALRERKARETDKGIER